MSLRTTMLTSAFATAAFVVACGGTNKKGAVPFESDDAGAAGEGSEPTGGKGGSAGAKEMPEPSAGEAGMTEAGGGAAGAPEAAGAAGEAGSPPVESAPVQVLFTVAAGAKGLTGSALAGSSHPSSVIFGSVSSTPEAVDGTNEVMITAAQLGIADSDTIDAFTILRSHPASPLYLFSLRSVTGEQGQRPTRLNRSSLEDGAPGDVYFSDTTVSFRWQGEGGDQLGYNGLIADEQSLGLSSVLSEQNERDDLTGVVPLLDGKLPTEIYFSVSHDSVGLADTALSSSEASDRGCTVYKSALDGKNTVAYTCAQLGLAPNADVKGLSVLSSAEGAPTVLFTIDSNSNGLPESDVGAQIYRANYVYTSTGNGTNVAEISGVQLGLDSYDEIDALAVLDRTPQAYSTPSACNLNPSPLDSAGANLTDTLAAHGLGPNLILVSGPALDASETTVNAVGAYNVKTCAFVARSVVDSSLQGAWTPVPLSGWTAAAPLKKLEYWLLVNDGESGALVLSRLDAAGVILNTYGFTGIPDPDQTGYDAFQLAYDAANDRLVALIAPKAGGSRAYVRVELDRPASTVPNDSVLEVRAKPLPHPCAFAPDFSGVDGDGNSYFAQWDHSGYPGYRVCPLTPSGEFSDLPFSVSVGTAHTSMGMIVPGDSIYALVRHNPVGKDDPITFELARQALTGR